MPIRQGLIRPYGQPPPAERTRFGFFGKGKVDLSRIYAALIPHLSCLAFESQGAFASQR
jgi:hypothetical protein